MSLLGRGSVVKVARLATGLLTAWMFVMVALAQGQDVTYPAPPAMPPSLPAGAVPETPPPTLGPSPTINSGVQLPPPQWDPYATPGSQPPALFSQDPTFASPNLDSFYARVTDAKRFVQELRFDYTFLPGNGLEEFAINTLEASGTFAIPFFYNRQHPLLLTPGFAVHYWSGPKAPDYDMPPNAFDAYLDTAWNPQPTTWLAGELSFRVGVYSDFRKVTSESIRYMGKGMAVLSFTPSIKFKFGVWYLDRNRIKLLPAGGIVWTPNPDVRLDILFPNPKIARRIINIGNTEWWLYARGEYGGGNWTILREHNASFESVDYNDIRFAFGLDFVRQGGLKGLIEVGVAFDREILFKTAPTRFAPDTAFLLRAGLRY